MMLVLAFGVVLVVSVSLSGVAARTVLSTALLFLVAGALAGPGGFALVRISPADPLVTILADLALFHRAVQRRAAGRFASVAG